MKIHGFQTLTLLDYPEHLACTVFLGHCNFRCPFCQNGRLVLYPEQEPVVEEKEILEHLKRRKGILEGVCITGGEPTLHPELGNFIRKIKELGYKVKLDTNGYRPEVIKELVAEGLLDYVAMDIKNAPARYAETAGLKEVDLLRIQDSVEFLLEGRVDYEFRTTVVREMHGWKEFETLGRWLKGCRRYFLQNYRASEGVISPIFTGYSREQLERFRDLLRKDISQVEIRGVD